MARTILIVDDGRELCELVSELLRGEGASEPLLFEERKSVRISGRVRAVGRRVKTEQFLYCAE